MDKKLCVVLRVCSPLSADEPFHTCKPTPSLCCVITSHYRSSSSSSWLWSYSLYSIQFLWSLMRRVHVYVNVCTYLCIPMRCRCVRGASERVNAAQVNVYMHSVCVIARRLCCLCVFRLRYDDSYTHSVACVANEKNLNFHIVFSDCYSRLLPKLTGPLLTDSIFLSSQWEAL